jgi:NAD+ kinase
VTRIAIVGNGRKPTIRKRARQFADRVAKCAEVACVDLDKKEDLSELDVDFVVIFGGDGSLLEAARRLEGRPVPAIGVNLGTLGLLAEFNLDELEDRFPAIADGRYRTVELMLVGWELRRAGEVVAEGSALNDLAITCGLPARVFDVGLVVGSENVATYRGDGIVVATSTGSTAYSLAAGGPIVHRDVDAFVVSPLCAHTLTTRPLVLPATSALRLTAHPKLTEVGLTVDVQEWHPAADGDEVTVRRLDKRFRLVTSETKSYFQILREKLRWQDHPNYGEENAG